MRRIDSENKVFGIVLLWLALASVAIGGGWQVYAGAGVLGQTTLLYEDWVRSSPILDAELTVSYSHFSMESGVRFVRYSYSDTVKLHGSPTARDKTGTDTMPFFKLSYNLCDDDEGQGYNSISIGLQGSFGQFNEFTVTQMKSAFEVDNVSSKTYNWLGIGPFLYADWNIPKTTLHLFGDFSLLYVSGKDVKRVSPAMGMGLTTYFLLWDGESVQLKFF